MNECFHRNTYTYYCQSQDVLKCQSVKGLLLNISLRNGPSFLKLKTSDTNHNKIDA